MKSWMKVGLMFLIALGASTPTPTAAQSWLPACRYTVVQEFHWPRPPASVACHPKVGLSYFR
jgi:hypothetical protein